MTTLSWTARVGCSFLVLLLGSCASLQGVPVRLTNEAQQSLASQDLTEVLRAADALSRDYGDAVGANQYYNYWSNLLLFPIAAIAAVATYKKNTSGVAVAGILGGTVVAFNSFTNAKANARAYQSGVTALTCLRTKVGPYALRTPEAKVVVDGADELADKIADAQALLKASQSLALTTDLNLSREVAADRLLPGQLGASEKAIAQAIAEAQQAVNAARNEATLFLSLPYFTADGVRNIETAVASKITLGDVNYSALLSGLTGTQKPAAAAPPKQPGPGAGPVLASIKQSIDSLRAGEAELARLTTALKDKTTKFGLSGREQEVGACLKAI